MILDIFRVALPFGDDLVFAGELVGRLPEGLFVGDLPAARLAAQLEIPVLGEILGAGEAVLLRAHAPVLAGEASRTLP
ncbi:MAG: hypothetical protein NUV72_06440 [Bauldia sp.]|nr:hypothetical protein [Bauldia sp.]